MGSIDLSDPDRTIWRYLTFSQFVSIIRRRKLYFSALSTFNDPFEGSFPEPESGSNLELSEEYDIEKLRKILPKFVFANCWHINEHETAFMWNQYSNEGIAIKSTIGDLRESFDTSEKGAWMYEVDYINYECEEFKSDDRFAAYFHKRRSFRHEQELRLLFEEWPPQEESVDMEYVDSVLKGREPEPQDLVEGQFHEIDVDDLINEVYISPRKDENFKELVVDYVKTSDDSFPVNHSSLSNDPVY